MENNFEMDADFLMSALNSYWNQANTALERKNLGDIERKNYQFEKDTSKKYMDEIELNGLPYKQLSSLQADNKALNEQLENGANQYAYAIVDNERLREALNEVKDFLHVLPMLRLGNKQGFDECINIEGVKKLEILCDAALNNIENK